MREQREFPANEPLSPEFWAEESDIADLVGLQFYDSAWKGNIDIVPNWQGPGSDPHGKGKVVILLKLKYLREPRDGEDPERAVYLRHSKGPHQGFFWDSYPDDMLNVAIALRAVMECSFPWHSFCDWERMKPVAKEMDR